MKLIHEEKRKKLIPKEEVPVARGQVIWIDKQKAEELKIDSRIFEGTDVEEQELQSFKEDLVRVLSESGFVFFDMDKTFYRLKMNNRGRITDFLLNYTHIR